MIFISFSGKPGPRRPREIRRAHYALAGFPEGIARRIVGVRIAQFERLTTAFDKTPHGGKLRATVKAGENEIRAINRELLAKRIGADQADARTKRRVLEAWESEAEYAEELTAFMENKGAFAGVTGPNKKWLRLLQQAIANPPWRGKK